MDDIGETEVEGKLVFSFFKRNAGSDTLFREQ